MTTFDAEATLFLSEVARKLQNQTSAFAWQRCLMDGGSCEATAFAGFDYRVGGLCLPLGNYHNIGRDKRARAEYVSVDDLMNLVKLTTAAAEQWRGFARVKKTLHAQVLNIRRSAPRTLEPIRLTR
jgi:endoglucanase